MNKIFKKIGAICIGIATLLVCVFAGCSKEADIQIVPNEVNVAQTQDFTSTFKQVENNGITVKPMAMKARALTRTLNSEDGNGISPLADGTYVETWDFNKLNHVYFGTEFNSETTPFLRILTTNIPYTGRATIEFKPKDVNGSLLNDVYMHLCDAEGLPVETARYNSGTQSFTATIDASVLDSIAFDVSGYPDFDFSGTFTHKGTYMLQAIVSPESVENAVYLDWSVAWASPSSDWATGKTVTDYVTVTPTTNGSKSAEVICNQSFGEQVILTVKVRNYEDVNATCTIDYKQKISSVDFSFRANVNGNIIGDWQLNGENTILTVDYMYLPISSSDFSTDYTNNMAIADASATWVNEKNYTINTNSSELTQFYIIPTQAYLDVLSQCGFNVDVSAGEKISLKLKDLSYHDLLIKNFTAAPYTNFTSAVATNLLSLLNARSNEVMLHIIFDSSTYSVVYDIKFNPTSTDVASVDSVSVLSSIIF